MAEDLGKALDYDGTLQEVPDNEFEPVAPGEYTYEVEAVERGQFNGSDKMGACPIAKVRIRLLDEPRHAVMFENLMLNSKVAWKIGLFFKSCGLRPVDAGKDVPLRMDWPGSIGRQGRCKVTTREYKGKTYNDVEFLKPQVAAPANPQMAQAQSAIKAAFPGSRPMTPGSF